MEATTQVYSDQFSEYFRDRSHDALELRWLPSTESMTEEQFRGGLERLAGLLEKDHAGNVLIDVVNFSYQPAADNGAWREKNIIPRYNAAGVSKFAFLLPQAATQTVEHGTAPAPEGAARFPTGYFSAREDVFSWFDGKPM